MKVLNIFLITIFFACGKTASTPRAIKSGLKDYSGINAIKENRKYLILPDSIMMVWYPSLENYNGIKSENKIKKENIDFLTYKSTCVKSIAINSNKNLIAAEVKYKTENILYKEKENKEKILFELNHSYSNLKCSSESEESSCVDLLDEINEIENRLEEIPDELDTATYEYYDAVAASLKDIQGVFDPHIDWENSYPENQEKEKINMVYPHFDSNYDGYIFDIKEKITDYKIVFNRFSSQNINYDSESGDIKIMESRITSIGNRFFVIRIFEKNTNNIKTGTYIDLEVEESFIYGSRRYEGKTFRYHEGQVIQEGIFKLEQAGARRD